MPTTPVLGTGAPDAWRSSPDCVGGQLVRLGSRGDPYDVSDRHRQKVVLRAPIESVSEVKDPSSTAARPQWPPCPAFGQKHDAIAHVASGERVKPSVIMTSAPGAAAGRACRRVQAGKVLWRKPRAMNSETRGINRPRLRRWSWWERIVRASIIIDAQSSTMLASRGRVESVR